MNYSSLEDVYGGPFGQRQAVTHVQKERMENPPTPPPQSAASKHKDLLASVTKTLPLDTSPPPVQYPPPPPPQQQQRRTAAREHFYASPDPPIDDHSEKLSRILRLIEQNRTGYERPVTQDMMLYIATGVFFLFTFDTFVMLGKSMA